MTEKRKYGNKYFFGDFMKKNMIICLFLIFYVSLIFTEDIWEDNFETETGWVLSGEFEIDTPQGLGGDYGYPDPSAAYEGLKVLGVDLNGLGYYPGDYENNLTDREYYAISPPVDCSEYIDVQLSFMNWLNVEQPAYDHAYIDISNDNGSSWIEIWTNNTVITDNNWAQENYDISNIADLNSNVRIRFSIGSTDYSWQYSGWNIDNLIVTGTSVDFGAIGGEVSDTQTGDPIHNAQIINQFGFTSSNENGNFLLTNIPEGIRSITVIALGYLDLYLDNIEVFADDTTYVICELEIDPNIPPEPQNLSAEIFDENNVHLWWDEPEYSDDILLAYNVYKNGIVIQSVLNEEYDDLNLINGIYYYFVTAVYDTGTSLPSNEVEVEINVSNVNNDQLTITNFQLTNYPNPFNPETTISYSLKDNVKVLLKIYNIKGQKVRNLVDEVLPAGEHTVIWDGRDSTDKRVGSGIYFYKLRAGDFQKVKKMILLK
jgi:hypothetical protein